MNARTFFLSSAVAFAMAGATLFALAAAEHAVAGLRGQSGGIDLHPPAALG